MVLGGGRVVLAVTQRGLMTCGQTADADADADADTDMRTTDKNKR